MREDLAKIGYQINRVTKMDKTISVATFNIQSTRRHPDRENIDPAFCMDVIKEYMPDILGLNEVSSGVDYGDQPKEIAEALGYPYYYYAPVLYLEEGRRIYGNALLSKYPIKSAETIVIDDPEVKDEDAEYETRCILKADIDVLGGMTVYVSHFGLANGEKANAVKEVMRRIGENSKRNILMGDFNMKSDDDIIRPLYDILKDTASICDEDLYTFPSDNPRCKIDYIFVSEDFEVCDTSVSDKIGSDHKMLMTKIRGDVL